MSHRSLISKTSLPFLLLEVSSLHCSVCQQNSRHFTTALNGIISISKAWGQPRCPREGKGTSHPPSSPRQRHRFTCDMGWSQNQRMVGVGRDLCGSSSPTPCRSRVTYSRLHRTTSRRGLNISRARQQVPDRCPRSHLHTALCLLPLFQTSLMDMLEELWSGLGTVL